MKILNSGGGPFRFASYSRLGLTSDSSNSVPFQSASTGFNGSQNLQRIQNNLNSGINFFANNPSVQPLKYHRLNPNIPLINLNSSGKGPVIIGVDTQAKQHPHNQNFIARQGVNYINGFGGGSIFVPNRSSYGNVGNTTV